jgi:hypothetical protein
MNAVLQDHEIPVLGGTLDSYGIKVEMWELWKRCWDRNVGMRPAAVDALHYCLSNI